MTIIPYAGIKATRYESDEIKGVEARVVIGKNDGAENFCMRVFEFSPGGYSRKHSHDWEHEMFIHSGKGEIFNNGKWSLIKTGNAVFIPSNEEHQIRNNSTDLLILVCLIPSKAPEL